MKKYCWLLVLLGALVSPFSQGKIFDFENYIPGSQLTGPVNLGGVFFLSPWQDDIHTYTFGYADSNAENDSVVVKSMPGSGRFFLWYGDYMTHPALPLQHFYVNSIDVRGSDSFDIAWVYADAIGGWDILEFSADSMGDQWQTINLSALTHGRPIWRMDFGSPIYGTPESTRLSRFELDNINVSPIPEPTTYALIGIGLLGLAGVGRKRH
ncbi:hypothetical protein YWS52_13990 [Chitiniphilus shinanonensis]